MTRLMVLGLLSLKAMSGYEIQQLIQLSHADKWAGILPGSIYHALKKMETEGLVQLETIEQTGNRSKAIYSITEQGRDEYHKLIRVSLEELSVPFPTGLYTGLVFVHALPKEEARAAIESQIHQTEQRLEESKFGEAQKENMPEFGHYIFEHMFEVYNLHLAFLRKLYDKLEGNPVGAPELPAMDEDEEEKQ